MSALVRLRPHQPPFIMLNPHNPLPGIQPRRAILRKDSRVLQIRNLDINRRRRLLLEAELAVPGHVLDAHQCSISDEDHVVVARRDQEAVRRFDDLRDDVLDRHGRRVRAEDAVLADLPVDVQRRVHGCFDVRAVEIGGGAVGREFEFCGEREHVPEQRAHLVDFVDVEAGVYLQGDVVDCVEDVACFAGPGGGGLHAGGREGEVFGAVVGEAAGLVEGVELCH